jgi:hypothetical protein
MGSGEHGVNTSAEPCRPGADRKELTMPQTVEQGTAEIVARYIAVWNEADPESRRRAVQALWSADGAEFVEGTMFRGHDELCARINGAHEQFVSSGRYTATAADDVSRHDDILTFTIQLSTPHLEVAWAARVFLLLDADGVIHEDYQLTVKPLAE